MKKIPVSIYLLLLFCLSGVNFALRYFNLPNYFFVIGFRFYWIIFLTGIFLLFYQGFETFKHALLSFSFKKFSRFIIFVLIPPVVIIGTLFLLNKIEIGDPDYFYELGLSSLVDFPVYFTWNFPQFFILFTLLQTVESSFRLKILPNFLLLLFFFSSELLSFPKISFDVFSTLSFAVLLFTVAFFIYKRTNVLTFSFYFFTTVWMALLLFGSKSETPIQIFLAKTYIGWDGFFDINKKFIAFIFPVYFLLSFLPVVFLKKEKTKHTPAEPEPNS
ncbi:MAG: hypothetical protein WC557_06140 [Ignavibacteriaceae bacterium]